MKTEAGMVDLERLALSSGQARKLDGELRVKPITLAGETYEVKGGAVDAHLDVSRTTSGYALRLSFEAPVSGPCVRCLEEATLALQVAAREVDQPGSGDDELRSPYVSEGQVDVEHWANDAIVLALPAKPICREDCAGLCAVCGKSLNDTDPAEHRHESGGDPRMAKLRDLKLD
jgi:uncharacterized protein